MMFESVFGDLKAFLEVDVLGKVDDVISAVAPPPKPEKSASELQNDINEFVERREYTRELVSKVQATGEDVDTAMNISLVGWYIHHNKLTLESADSELHIKNTMLQKQDTFIIDAIRVLKTIRFFKLKGLDNPSQIREIIHVTNIIMDSKTGLVRDDIKEIVEKEELNLDEVYKILALMDEYATYRNEEQSKCKEIENKENVTAVQDIQGFMDFVLKEMKGTATEEERKIIQDQKGDLKKSIEILCAYLSNKNIFNEE